MEIYQIILLGKNGKLLAFETKKIGEGDLQKITKELEGDGYAVISLVGKEHESYIYDVYTFFGS